MTQVSFSGSGTDSIDNQVGKGKGLNIGRTKIDFASGKIQLNDGETIGNFRTFKKQGGESNECKTFAFKAKTKCIVEFQNTFIDYNLINEWIILQGIQTDEIILKRTATGATVDIFDFVFIGSDDPKYKISIEKGTRDSDIETVFSSESRNADTYTQAVNVQGAKKIILAGKQTAGTGTVDISIEIFDPASQSWIEHVPKEDIFSLANGQFKRAQIGDTISRKTVKSDEWDYISHGNTDGLLQGEIADSTVNGGMQLSSIQPLIGYVLPSGDSLFRVKAVVNTNPATFSIGILKVFN